MSLTRDTGADDSGPRLVLRQSRRKRGRARGEDNKNAKGWSRSPGGRKGEEGGGNGEETWSDIYIYVYMERPIVDCRRPRAAVGRGRGRTRERMRECNTDPRRETERKKKADRHSSTYTRPEKTRSLG